jgi:hypothetical protein
MSNKWDTANLEEKLELLRSDIRDIATAHNALARDFRDWLHRLTELTPGSRVPKGTPPLTEETPLSTQRENNAGTPSHDQGVVEEGVTRVAPPLDR